LANSPSTISKLPQPLPQVFSVYSVFLSVFSVLNLRVTSSQLLTDTRPRDPREKSLQLLHLSTMIEPLHHRIPPTLPHVRRTRRMLQQPRDRVRQPLRVAGRK